MSSARCSGSECRLTCRVLQKGVTATVEITLRSTQNAGRPPTMPLETAKDNKEMGRVLIRRAGETIAAGTWPCRVLSTRLIDRCRAGAWLVSVLKEGTQSAVLRIILYVANIMHASSPFVHVPALRVDTLSSETDRCAHVTGHRLNVASDSLAAAIAALLHRRPGKSRCM